MVEPSEVPGVKSAAWSTVLLAGGAATGLVLVDRGVVGPALAPAFASMNALEQGAACGLLVAAVAAVMVSLDVGALVLGWLAGRKAPPLGTGGVVGGYLALSYLMPIIRVATGWQILGSGPLGRAAWALLLLGTAAGGAFLASGIRDRIPSPSARLRRVLAGLAALPVVGWLALVATVPANPRFDVEASADRPNVLVVVFDGVSADRTTVYGSARDTTPHLAQLAEGALIADNALPNACSTYGSMTAILSGRSALDVHMVYFPDRLSGEDSFAHLPGLLADGGYRVAVIGAQQYVDAASMGMRGDFAIVNQFGGPLELPGLTRDSRPLTNGLRLWLQDLASRVRVPVVDIVGLRSIATFDQTFNRREEGDADAWRVARFQHHVNTSAGEPWFAYVHLMGTHGPYFHPRERVFSSADSTGEWDVDAADDALRDADAHLGEMLAFLDARGALSNTIVAVLSDHAEEWSCGRVPFVVRLPNHAEATRLSGTVDLTDLAPTLASAVGMRPPVFMAGRNLMGDAPAAGRVTIHPWEVESEAFVPPGENLLSVAFRRCDLAWIVPVDGGPVEVTSIAGYRGSECAGLPALDSHEVQRQVFDHLEATGWR